MVCSVLEEDGTETHFDELGELDGIESRNGTVIYFYVVIASFWSLL